MIISNNIQKIVFAIGIIVSLLFYHVTNYFIKSISISDLYDIFKITQTVISAILGFIVVFNPFISKLLLRSYYIAGNYEGESGGYKDENDKIKPNHVELFTISQNIFDSYISGQSFRKNNNELISTWEGKLIKIEGKTLYFATELSTRKGEFGTLSLSLKNKSEIIGFYYSGNPENKIVPYITAKKNISKSST